MTQHHRYTGRGEAIPHLPSLSKARSTTEVWATGFSQGGSKSMETSKRRDRATLLKGMFIGLACAVLIAGGLCLVRWTHGQERPFLAESDGIDRILHHRVGTEFRCSSVSQNSAESLPLALKTAAYAFTSPARIFGCADQRQGSISRLPTLLHLFPTSPGSNSRHHPDAARRPFDTYPLHDAIPLSSIQVQLPPPVVRHPTGSW